MKKRILMLLLACILLTGCGSSSTSAADTAAATEAAVAAPSHTAVVGAADEQNAETEAKAYISYDYSAEASLDVGGMNYFSFASESKTYQSTDGTDLLLEVLPKTEFTADSSAQETWIDGILQQMYQVEAEYGQSLLVLAEEDHEELGENFYCYSHYVSQGVARHDDRVISLLSLSSVYSGGGHPNSVQTAYNLDMRSGQLLTLEDVIEESGAEELNRLIRSDVESRFASLGEGMLFDGYTGTIGQAMTYGSMTPYWYFNDQGLVVFFNQYTLGPYAAGIIKVKLAYEQLNGILKPEFFPEEQTGRVTGVSLEETPQDGQLVHYVDLGGRETFYIQISGRASQIQLSQIQYVEQTAVGQTMMFSANYLDDTATLAVTVDLSDTSRIYAVEYFDEISGPNVLYLQGTKIMTELP